MPKFYKILSVCLACLFVGAISLYAGFEIISNKNISDNLRLTNNIQSGISVKDKSLEIDKNKDINKDFKIDILEGNKTDVLENNFKIYKSTIIVYEYYNISTGKMEVEEEEPPYFMIGFTEEELKSTFRDWLLISFNSERVVMRKNIQDKKINTYVVGVQQGYVAIFTREPENKTTLKELTEIPVSALPIEEQQRLLNGIEIVGEDKLYKILEDYGS